MKIKIELEVNLASELAQLLTALSQETHSETIKGLSLHTADEIITALSEQLTDEQIETLTSDRVV